MSSSRARPPLRALALTLLCVVASACPGGMSVVRDGERMSVEQAADRDLVLARELIEAERFEQARRVLDAFEVELSRSRRRDEALYLSGQVLARLGEHEAAAHALRRVVEQYPRSTVNADAALLAAGLYRDLGRPEAGRRLLERARWQNADELTRARIHRLRADLARLAGDWPDAVVALALSRRDTADSELVREIDLEIDDLLEGRVGEAQLAQLLDELPRGPVFDRASLRLARLALLRGDHETALDVLERLPRRLSPQDEGMRQRLLARARRGTQSAVETIGLAVPLSGPYALFGEAVLRGVTLSLGLFDDPEARFRVLVRDTEGDVAKGAAAVAELVDLGVSAVIGPVRSSVTAAAAPAAEAGGVPLLSLSRREDVSYLGDFVFRLGLTSSDQARFLAEHYMSREGFRDFAILYPRDSFGAAFKNLFWDEVEARQGRIVGVERYDPEAVDWQREIKRLVGLEPVTSEERELLDERERLRRRPQANAERLEELAELELPPYVDFEALLIPDIGSKVGLILPQLRFYDVREVVFLGGAAWNDPKLIEIAGRLSEGVVFTTDFDAGSDASHVSDFVERYRATYAHDPDVLAAEGFDAAALLRAQISGPRSISREELRRRLLDVRDWPGVSGLTSFDESGGTRKELTLMTVRNGRFEPL